MPPVVAPEPTCPMRAPSGNQTRPVSATRSTGSAERLPGSVGAPSRSRRQLLSAGLAGVGLLTSRQALGIGPSSRLQIARLELPGLQDPRPTALTRLSWEMERRTSVITQPTALSLTANDPRLFQHPFLVLSGRTGFTLPSEAAANRLRRYLTYGGFLLIDSAEGRAGGAFDESVRALMAQILPGDLPTAIKDDHVLWKSFYVIRDAEFGRIVAAPYVEGVIRDQRIAVLYTQNDLCGAMAKDGFGRWEHEVIPGGANQREMSFRFAVNALMYALCLDYKDEQAHIDFVLRRRRGF